MVAHACNGGITWETEAGGSYIQSRLELHTKTCLKTLSQKVNPGSLATCRFTLFHAKCATEGPGSATGGPRSVTWVCKQGEAATHGLHHTLYSALSHQRDCLERQVSDS